MYYHIYGRKKQKNLEVLTKCLVFSIMCRANQRSENQGLGVDRPDEVCKDDDEFEAYRKRMMLAYRFRPNPLVSA